MNKCDSCVDFDGLQKAYNLALERMRRYRKVALKLTGSQARLAEALCEVDVEDAAKLEAAKAQQMEG